LLLPLRINIKKEEEEEEENFSKGNENEKKRICQERERISFCPSTSFFFSSLFEVNDYYYLSSRSRCLADVFVFSRLVKKM